MSDRYLCSVCKDQGWIPDPKNYRIHIECEHCTRPKRYEREYTQANLPVFLHDIEWRNIEKTPARNKLIKGARLWLNSAYAMHRPDGNFRTRGRAPISARKNFLIHGPGGTGKTMFATLMAKSLIRRGVKVLRGDLHRYRDAFFNKPDAETAVEDAEFRRSVRDMPVLILEFGEEPDHRYSGPKLIELLKARMDKGFCTILVSSISPDFIISKYGGGFCKMTELSRLFTDNKVVMSFGLPAVIQD